MLAECPATGPYRGWALPTGAKLAGVLRHFDSWFCSLIQILCGNCTDRDQTQVCLVHMPSSLLLNAECNIRQIKVRHMPQLDIRRSCLDIPQPALLRNSNIQPT
jgi:hypothetical protein